MKNHNSIINIFTIEIHTHLAQTRPDTMQTRHLVSKKSRKMVKKGVILTGGYSDSLVFLLIHLLYTTAEPSFPLNCRSLLPFQISANLAYLSSISLLVLIFAKSIVSIQLWLFFTGSDIYKSGIP